MGETPRHTIRRAVPPGELRQHTAHRATADLRSWDAACPVAGGSSDDRACEGGPYLVLVAEDHEDTRELWVLALTLDGFVVEEAVNRCEALGKASDSVPDLIIVDVGLPDMDGFDLCRRIKQDGRTSGVPVVAVTGYSGRRYREDAAAAGFDEYVMKPVAPDELCAHIREVLARMPGRLMMKGVAETPPG